MRPTFLQPLGYTGPNNRFCHSYRSLDNPSLVLRPRGNPARGYDVETVVVQQSDGAILEIGVSHTCGGIVSVRYHRHGKTWDLLMRDDAGKQMAGVPGRFRFVLADGTQVEINPTFHGGAAATTRIFPSLMRSVAVTRFAYGDVHILSDGDPFDYDPRNRENAEFGVRPIGDRPDDTQIAYLRMPSQESDLIAADANECHSHGLVVTFLDGTPPDVARVLMGVVSCGWYAPDAFRGGAVLLDMINPSSRREITAAEWLARTHQDWNAVGVGGKARIDYLPKGFDAAGKLVNLPAEKQPAVGHSGHTGCMLLTDQRDMALGFYAQIKPEQSPLGEPTAFALKTRRIANLPAGTDLQAVNSSVGVVVASRKDDFVGPMAHAEVRFQWTFGTPEEVEQRLYRAAAAGVFS